MGGFSFISDKVLENNLEIALDHIIDLLALSESDSYKGKKTLISSLRKTIVIHNASIIEALLLWKLRQKVKNKEIEIDDEWNYLDVKILHRTKKSEEIIGARRKKEIKKINRLDFDRIINSCVKYKIIEERFSKDVHKVRKLRNRLHIGGLKEMERNYTKKDLEFVFGVVRRARNVVSK